MKQIVRLCVPFWGIWMFCACLPLEEVGHNRCATSDDCNTGNVCSEEGKCVQAAADTSSNGSSNFRYTYVEVSTLTGCGCDETEEVCGHDGKCIPRCDAFGRCLEAVVDGEKQISFMKDKTLLLYEAPQKDPLGNPVSGMRLWRLNRETGVINTILESDAGVATLGMIADELVVVEFTDPLTVHRLSLEGNPIVALTLPDGLPVDYEGLSEWQIWGALNLNDNLALDGTYLYYIDENDGSVWRLAVEANAEPEQVIPADAYPGEAICSYDDYEKYFTVTESVVWWNQCQLCVVDLKNSTSPACDNALPTYEGKAEKGTRGQLVVSKFVNLGEKMPLVDIMDASLSSLRIFKGDDYSFSDDVNNVHFAFDDNWAYSLAPGTTNVLSFPLHVPRLPQELFPASLITAPDLNYGNFDEKVKAGAHHLVWLEPVLDDNEEVVRTLVVSIPIPPRMCDAELPCAAENETCGDDGICVSSN